MLFRKAFYAAPTCSGSRAYLLTGLYAHSNGSALPRGCILHAPTVPTQTLRSSEQRGIQCSLVRARSGAWQWILDYLAEDPAAVYLDVDGFPALEVQVPGVFAGYLGPDVALVFEGQLDAYLKPNIDEVVDHCLGGRTVGVKLDLDIVWTDIGVSQAVHGHDKAHDELVGGLLVEVLWAAYLLYLAV